MHPGVGTEKRVLEIGLNVYSHRTCLQSLQRMFWDPVIRVAAFEEPLQEMTPPAWKLLAPSQSTRHPDMIRSA